ncbi:YvrJ family protein [Kurthia massiliensis]|nr:YvrJ family protein [Kurthia massiliensis]
MEQLFQYFDYGFSFLLAIYLLTRMEKKIEALTTSIIELTHAQNKD